MSFYHWLGAEAEQPLTCIKMPDDAEFHHLGDEVEDDGWITIYPQV
jgi:hypothetical protein